MGITERRLREKEKVKADILATAWQMVKEEGWQSLSIRKLADGIEYSVPVIYDYFKNKEAILAEFVDQGFRLLQKRIRLAKNKHQDPGNQLKAMAIAYWNFALENKEYYQLMYGVNMVCCSGECQDNSGFDEYIMESIEKAIAGSRHPDASPCLKYHTYWSILHGLVSIKITGKSPVNGELNKVVLEDAIEGFIKNLN
jgi:AcrR family transcriptional regulator